MKSKIKPYDITIATHSGLTDYDSIGFFFKDGFFIIERPDGRRLMINRDIIEEIWIDEDWNEESS